jgi:hypothetical protein
VILPKPLSANADITWWIGAKHLVLNVTGKRAGLRIAEHAVDGFVSTLAKHARADGMAHHVVRVSGGEDWFSGIFALHTQAVIDASPPPSASNVRLRRNLTS